MQTLKSKQSHKNGLNGGKSMPATNLEQQEAIVPEKIYVSVVIPIYNEAENLPLLFTQMQQALDNLTQPGEVILVDDGSKDNSYSIMKQFPEKDERFQVICLRRNFGQTAAFSAGFDHSRGEIIITMDGDLQNDPMDMPKLLEKVDEGYDIVSGWRHNRQDKFITRKLPSQMANRLISR
ncbi:MAG: glycosyltransferase family 2 protein, partial [Anaerolineales bacterium]|nr:glycosyltransferase family 2 protein [Anaerolineales bacterium]